MGLNRTNLPDSILDKIHPQDRRSAGLPAPMPKATITRIQQCGLPANERALQNQIENWLRLKGITAIRSRMDRKTSNNKGTPDFLFAVKGRAVAVECKLPGIRPTIEQQKILVALANDGWKVAVIHTLDELRSLLASLV
jgi:hypothetical protein